MLGVFWKIQEICSKMGTRILKIDLEMTEIIDPKIGVKSLFLDFYFFSQICRSVYRPTAANGLKQFSKFLCPYCFKFPEFSKTPPTFKILLILKGVMVIQSGFLFSNVHSKKRLSSLNQNFSAIFKSIFECNTIFCIYFYPRKKVDTPFNDWTCMRGTIYK